jgi:hypothetical protein
MQVWSIMIMIMTLNLTLILTITLPLISNPNPNPIPILEASTSVDALIAAIAAKGEQIRRIKANS